MNPENASNRWSEDEDMILAEAALRNIREGNILSEAMKRVADEIGRSEGTCTMRWHSVIKRKYKEAIQLAKAQRGRQRGLRIAPDDVKPVNKFITVEDVTSFIVHAQKENEELRNEVESLKNQLEEKDAKYKQTHEDYQAFLKIFDRARKSAFLTDDEEKEKQKFKMDRNGNLERIN